MVEAFNMLQRNTFSDPYIMSYQPWGWHLHLYDAIKTSPSKQNIQWWWNDTFCIGKTTISCLLMMKYPQHVYVIKNPDDKKSTLRHIATATKNGWNRYCLIIELSWDYNNKKWIYSLLEDIKDSHVIVFSTFEPQLYTKYGQPLIDMSRIKVVKIPIDPTIKNPNPPREQKQIDLPEFI